MDLLALWSDFCNGSPLYFSILTMISGMFQYLVLDLFLSLSTMDFGLSTDFVLKTYGINKKPMSSIIS